MKNGRSYGRSIVKFCATVVMFCSALASCKKDDQSPAPSVAGINPTQGEIGADVTITGINFSSNASENTVTFSGLWATLKSASSTQLVAVVPANAVTGPVQVTVNGQTAAGPTFTVLTPVPLTVASVSPTSAMVGSDVTLAGTGFSTTLTDNVVKVNGVAAVVKSATATQLVITIPAGATSGAITIEVKGKSASLAGFTVTPALTVSDMQPMTGPKGTEVTLTGTGFSTTPTNNKVTFNGKEAIVKSATATSLVVEVPTRAGTGKVSVVLGSQHVDGPEFQYEFTYTVETIAGGTAGDADGTGTAAQFKGLIDLVVAKDGNIYAAEINNARIRKITPAGVVTTFAGSSLGYSDNADPLQAKFGYLNGITQDADGNFYVSEGLFIRKIDVDGKVTTLAGNLTNSSVDGTGTAASFSGARAVQISSAGDLYVADSQGNVIRKVTLGGVVTTIGGTAGAGNAGYQDGPAATAKFNSPYGAIADDHGNIYIADYLNHMIRNLSAGKVTTLTGSTMGSTDGDPSVAKFSAELGPMAMDAEGNVYVADSHGVRMISPTGHVTTIAGKLADPGFTNGVGVDARFKTPMGIDFDSKGNLYVADSGNNAIRKITIE